MLFIIYRLHSGRLHTVIMCMGHLYGDGEDVFHFWFKQAWMGDENNMKLPIFGSGIYFVL
jgi:hypothetical protein